MNSATEHRKPAAILFTGRVGYRAPAQRHEALALELTALQIRRKWST